MSQTRILPLAVLTFLLIGLSQIVDAKPKHKQTLGRYYGENLPAAMQACATCHIVPAGVHEAQLVEHGPDHNAFGKRLADVAEATLAAAAKAHAAAKVKPADNEESEVDLVARLRQVASEDSDGDGVANELELLAGTFPGDAKNKPTAAALELARRQQQELQERYRWEPFTPVQRPALPNTVAGSWSEHPVDAFLAVEHARRGVKPRPEAPRATLLRRLYLDLIGLPPTPEELHAFLNDTQPDAYERVVDRLLSSPRHGERWGRHWMDIWRYSDWTGWGNQVRDSKPHIWHWRDWIIEAHDNDKPYDQMIAEMLAADELYPDDPAALRATGFLARNFKLLSREQWLQDTVNHTSKAFLGITLDCARCHDHMYDAIPQKDYYRFRAIFEPHQVRTDRIPGYTNIDSNGLVRVYDADLTVPTYFFPRGDERLADKQKLLAPGVPKALGEAAYVVRQVSLPASAQRPDARRFVRDDDLKAAGASVVSAQIELARRRQAFAKAETTKGADVESARAAVAIQADAVAHQQSRHEALCATFRAEEAGVADPRASALAQEAVLAQRRERVAEKRYARSSAAEKARQAAEKARQAAAKGNLAAPSPTLLKAKQDTQKALMDTEAALQQAMAEAAKPIHANFTKPTITAYPATSTGRRAALARWLTDRSNPLTARVAVNHVWLRHFGQPLLGSVFDFGNNGQVPNYPALLDWLAAEFMEPSVVLVTNEKGARWIPQKKAATKWSLKHLHRLLVTSAAYKMASTGDNANSIKDPDNRFLWRMPSRRMEAEVVRDSILYVGQHLDMARGGPDLDYNEGDTRPRRSLYFRHAPEKQMTMLRVFDAAAPTECYRRKESIIPQQALALANSSLTLHQARRLARLLHAKSPDPATFCREVFLHVLARPAISDEILTCTQFLDQQRLWLENQAQRLTSVATEISDVTKPSASPFLRARENLVHVLFNHHDFITVR